MFYRISKLLLLVLIALPLYASVKLVAPKSVIQGEDVVFKIVAKGFEIKFPQIDFIQGCAVEEIKSESEAYLINNVKASKLTKSYRFVMQKRVKIPSFSLKIDGVVERTQAKEIELEKIHKSISDNYDLQMQVSKVKAYIGERLILKVILSYKDLEDYNMFTPKFPGFSIEELDEKSFKTASGEYVYETRYTLIPLKEGSFSLLGAKAEVEVLKKAYTNKNNRSKYTNKFYIYSNALRVDVLPLPENISVVGSYTIKSIVPNRKVKLGQALKLSLVIVGEGNINNIDAFTFEVPNATVYEKGVKQEKRANLDYFSKDFEIISQENFLVPSLSLSYYDTISKRINKLHTPSYFIEVIGSKNQFKQRDSEIFKEGRNSSLDIQKVDKEQGLSMIERVLYFIIGVIATVLSILIYLWIKKFYVVKKESSLVKELKRINTQEAFFKKVVPFIGMNRKLDRLIFALEEESMEFKKLKKELILLLGSDPI